MKRYKKCYYYLAWVVIIASTLFVTPVGSARAKHGDVNQLKGYINDKEIQI